MLQVRDAFMTLWLPDAAQLIHTKHTKSEKVGTAPTTKYPHLEIRSSTDPAARARSDERYLIGDAIFVSACSVARLSRLVVTISGGLYCKENQGSLLSDLCCCSILSMWQRDERWQDWSRCPDIVSSSSWQSLDGRCAGRVQPSSKVIKADRGAIPAPLARRPRSDAAQPAARPPPRASPAPPAARRASRRRLSRARGRSG
jgi:hypothetical protein